MMVMVMMTMVVAMIMVEMTIFLSNDSTDY